MTDPECSNTSDSKAAENPSPAPAASASDVPSKGENAPASGDEPVRKLTTDEQMALYEDYLKENDWGHQPC